MSFGEREEHAATAVRVEQAFEPRRAASHRVHLARVERASDELLEEVCLVAANAASPLVQRGGGGARTADAERGRGGGGAGDGVPTLGGVVVVAVVAGVAAAEASPPLAPPNCATGETAALNPAASPPPAPPPCLCGAGRGSVSAVSSSHRHTRLLICAYPR